MVLSQDDTVRLTQSIMIKEVTKEIMSMHSFKAHGLDGFQPYSFKKHWHIMRKEIWKLVHDAFHNGSFNPCLLETLVVRIRKISSPTSLKDLISISLCNMAYKVVTKVTVTDFVVLRLRKVLDGIRNGLIGNGV
ncbi:PREDICTED: uncharacterized protein LOC109359844 [Lupinus angustifolius]|uniref:uncharacterized protein LOC109359844 n=1 Tax=Lupinus angustifolius TaxID=3871 RepID=UPI00092EBD3F|nr:PREDICTED: uncharacterized protein LOC109359844 [Lupinus angustifolius]